MVSTWFWLCFRLTPPARACADVKKIGAEKFKSLFVERPPLTAAEERELKAQNEWAWKEPEKAVVDDDDEDMVTDGAAAAGSSDAATAGATAVAT